MLSSVLLFAFENNIVGTASHSMFPDENLGNSKTVLSTHSELCVCRDGGSGENSWAIVLLSVCVYFLLSNFSVCLTDFKQWWAVAHQGSSGSLKTTVNTWHVYR